MLEARVIYSMKGEYHNIYEQVGNSGFFSYMLIENVKWGKVLKHNINTYIPL